MAHQLGKEGPIEVVPTWLGAHAVPPELRGRPDATEEYVRENPWQQAIRVLKVFDAQEEDVADDMGLIFRYRATGDYSVEPKGLYGEEEGEGLRVDCSRLRAIGVVAL